MNKKTSKSGSKADSHFDALFGARQGEQLAGGFKLIPRDKITRGPQPRQSFPKDEIAELARSIEELRARGEGIEGSGLLQPLLVVEDGEVYRLIAGERRLRATEIAGVQNVPAIVTDLAQNNIVLTQLIENLQRRDLPPLEEARGIAQLVREQNLSLRDAARVLGKGKGYVENRLNLLKMSVEVQQMVSVQTDTLLHAREIDSVEDSQVRADLIQAVLQEGISRAEVRRRIGSGNEDVTHRADNTASNATSPLSVQTDSAKPLLSVQTDNSETNQLTGNEESNNRSQALNQALRSAVSFAAEAASGLKGLSLSPDHRTQVQGELDRLKKQIVYIEKLLK